MLYFIFKIPLTITYLLILKLRMCVCVCVCVRPSVYPSVLNDTTGYKNKAQCSKALSGWAHFSFCIFLQHLFQIRLYTVKYVET